uniref:Probable ATP-dependent transporter ycf16 n=1 Tax=Porolithon onkodes TaxID=231751 RepID=A0A2Z2KS81_9FLOR|nr:iron-sulfur cluster formation ABC transporter ATP-binding subunit [Porolithon onkodes]ASB29766.1 iron-sulfur cluster formation ABC transporter ATP-binding subunit [Porolithon onkodes]
MRQNLLEIKDLHIEVNNKKIIKGLNLSIKEGEKHAVMGPNGSGKSTLAKVIAGHPLYKITQGSIYLKNKNITNFPPEQRAQEGVFLAFQYPLEIPGVNNLDFLRLAFNAKLKYEGRKELDPLDFFEFIHKEIKKIDLTDEFLNRNVNEGFSGGEKKKNEILQMCLLNNELSILDETDSGLDIDALKSISKSINTFFNKKKSIILITHYQRLLDYVIPDFIHIMQNGKIIKTGNAYLAKQLEQHGYTNILTKT